MIAFVAAVNWYSFIVAATDSANGSRRPPGAVTAALSRKVSRALHGRRQETLDGLVGLANFTIHANMISGIVSAVTTGRVASLRRQLENRQLKCWWMEELFTIALFYVQTRYCSRCDIAPSPNWYLYRTKTKTLFIAHKKLKINFLPGMRMLCK